MPCPQIFSNYYFDLFTFVLFDAMVSHVLVSINYCITQYSIQKAPPIQYHCDVIFIYCFVSLWLLLELMDLLFPSCCHFKMMVMWVS